MYKNTNLTKDQFDFLVNWCNGLQRIQKPRSSENLKLMVEYLFFYISGNDMNMVMKETGIKGDRWVHNISAKQIKRIRSMHNRRGWHQSLEERMKELDYKDFL
ncbi:hypothetical protein [Sporosarcina sp. P17b]|uniref:hypothetical protein n=1 Tax=Sporosarcina sp. P17b TaxID=2048260 RepID=UPI000C16B24C|nr:hypothetical protein [Sporosarcina sp. P17b]PIC75036.1 hypothetical protein CSV76_00040 [Sporosarcina sp. P17b]